MFRILEPSPQGLISSMHKNQSVTDLWCLISQNNCRIIYCAYTFTLVLLRSSTSHEQRIITYIQQRGRNFFVSMALNQKPFRIKASMIFCACFAQDYQSTICFYSALQTHPCNENRGFPVYFSQQGKSTQGNPCSGPVLTL